MSTQPAADDFALAEGATPLAAVIEAEIAAAGRITFARFMELALGHPEHGYYARPGLAWGRDGDYETSPEVHPIFGYLWARQVAECWERLGSPAAFDLVEPGAGSGAFASAMLDWLRARAPDCYAAARVTLLDGHPRRGEEQQAALAAAATKRAPPCSPTGSPSPNPSRASRSATSCSTPSPSTSSSGAARSCASGT